MSSGIAPASPLFDLERAQTVPVSTSMLGFLFLFGFIGRQLVICAVTSLVLNYLWSFLAALYPNYFSLLQETRDFGAHQQRRLGTNGLYFSLTFFVENIALSVLWLLSEKLFLILAPSEASHIWGGIGRLGSLSLYCGCSEAWSLSLTCWVSSASQCLKRDHPYSLASGNGLRTSDC